MKTAVRILTLSLFVATCAAEAGPPGLSFDNAKNRYICTQCPNRYVQYGAVYLPVTEFLYAYTWLWYVYMEVNSQCWGQAFLEDEWYQPTAPSLNFGIAHKQYCNWIDTAGFTTFSVMSGVDWIPAYENQYWIHGDIVVNETVQPPHCYL